MPLALFQRPVSLLRLCGFAGMLWFALAGGVLAGDGRFDQGLLWRLDPPDGGRPSYLLGTMHVADPRVLDIPQAVRQALSASDTAVFEMIDSLAEQQAAAAPMFYQDGRSLDLVLGEELWEQTMAIARTYGLTSPLVRRYKPWGLLVLLSVPVEQMRAMMANGVVFDTLLQQEAARVRTAVTKSATGAAG